MKKQFLLLIVLTGLTCGPALEADRPAGAPASADEMFALLEEVVPALVRVEYFLRYDRSEEPESHDWGNRCASCGRFHTERIGDLVEEERPIERTGFLIAPDRVVTSHLLVSPRFIERISVTRDGETVDATPRSYAVDQKGVILGLTAPLAGARPLRFDGDPNSPLFAVTYQQASGQWQAGLMPFGEHVLIRGDGARLLQAPAEAVAVDRRGRAVGVTFREELPADGSWKTDPQNWKALSVEEVQARSSHLGGPESALVRATLHFRSPREEPGQSTRQSYYGGGGDEEIATQKDATAVILEDGLVLVLAAIPPSATARLEQIRIHQTDGLTTAEFVGSLKEYGALVARLDRPLPIPARLSAGPLDDLRGRLLFGVAAEVAGDQMQLRVSPLRMADLVPGRQRMLLPELAGDGENTLLFDLEGNLLALPVGVRERTLGQENRWHSAEEILLPATRLAEILNDLPAHIDPANTPKDEAEEQRIAWIGLDLQPLDANLARIHHVSTQTDDGDSGAVVTFVYPDSPAAAAGIEPGDILLRILVDGQSRPYPVRLSDERAWNEPFPWEQLDQIPEQYYHMLPHPWSPVANSFNRFLTDLGTGFFTLETAREGEFRNHLLEIVVGPPHYDSAPQYKAETIGLTVRELTFETRRFFQRDDESPGLVVARIEPGSSASVSGLKPFELITHVNDQPVRTIDEFSDAASAGGEIRLAVQRMHQGRIAIVRAPR